MDKERIRKGGDCVYRDTWKEKHKLKKRSENKKQNAFQKSKGIQQQLQ